MSTMSDDTNLILGSFRFAFAPTLPSTNANLPASYASDFGEVLNGKLKPSGDDKEMWESVGGILYLAKIIKTKRALTFTADIKKLGPTELAFYMGSTAGSAPSPGARTEGFGYLGITAEGEPIVEGAGASNKGAAIFAWYGFACSIMLDGELDAAAEDFSGLTLNVNAYLARARGTWQAATRPVLALS